MRGAVAFICRCDVIPILDDDRDGVLKRRLQEEVLQTFLADLDFDPAENRDILGLIGLVGFVSKLAVLHNFH